TGCGAFRWRRLQSLLVTIDSRTRSRQAADPLRFQRGVLRPRRRTERRRRSNPRSAAAPQLPQGSEDRRRLRRQAWRLVHCGSLSCRGPDEKNFGIILTRSSRNKVIRSICGRCFPPTLNNICPGTYDSLSQDLNSLRRRVTGLARRLVAVRRRAVLVVPEGERPRPRRAYGRRVHFEDAADNGAVGEHVGVIIVPFASRPRGRSAFEDQRGHLARLSHIATAPPCPKSAHRPPRQLPRLEPLAPTSGISGAPLPKRGGFLTHRPSRSA